jgi:hypothetical protein
MRANCKTVPDKASSRTDRKRRPKSKTEADIAGTKRSRLSGMFVKLI